MIPTDGSKYASRSRDVALEIAKKFNSTVVAVHIIDDKLIYPFEVLEDEGKSILSNIREIAEQADLAVEGEVLNCEVVLFMIWQKLF